MKNILIKLSNTRLNLTLSGKNYIYLKGGEFK